MSPYQKDKSPPNKTVKWLLITAGTVSLGLGSLGIILPLLPTTPFLLLTAACYIKSSEKLYNWLMNHRIYGNFLKNYLEHKAISLKVKIGSITLLWATIISSIIFFVPVAWIKTLLLVKAAIVTLHILSFKTLR